MKFEFDSPNYTTKTDLKNATELIHHLLVKRINLANLKSNVDKLDIDKLNNVPNHYRNLKSKLNKVDVDKSVLVTVDLSKLSDVVKIMSLKKMRKMLR